MVSNGAEECGSRFHPSSKRKTVRRIDDFEAEDFEIDDFEHGL
jgi:hypothetical protein